MVRKDPLHSEAVWVMHACSVHQRYPYNQLAFFIDLEPLSNMVVLDSIVVIRAENLPS